MEYNPTDNPTVAIRFVHKETRCPITELLTSPTLSVSALKNMLEKKFSEEYSNMRIVDKYNFEGMKCLTVEDDDKSLSEVLPEGSTHYCYLEGPMTDTLDGLGQAVAISKVSHKQDIRDLRTEFQHLTRFLIEQVDNLSRALERMEMENTKYYSEVRDLKQHIRVLKGKVTDLESVQKKPEVHETSRTAASICPLPRPNCGTASTSRNRAASSNIANPKAKSSSPQTRKNKRSSSTQVRAVMPPLADEVDDVVGESLNGHSHCTLIGSVFEAMRQGALTDDITSQIQNLESGSASQTTEADGAIDVALACGSTPVTMAVVSGRMDVLKELIASSPLSFTITDVDGRSPLHMSCFTGCAEATQLLMKAIANDSKHNADSGLTSPTSSSLGHAVHTLVYIEQRDHEGHTPLHIAAMSGHPKCIEVLLSNGADIDAKEANPLHQHKTKPGSAPCRGRSALHICAEGENAECLELLIAKGADVNCIDVWGRTPLHIAYEQGNTCAIEALLEANASTECECSKGMKPIDYAKARLLER